MFKALIIQRLFNLSDEQLEYQITDRLSFTRFLGLHIGETLPDYMSFWGFREALAEKGLERQLFNQFSSKLEAEGVFAKNGSIIDATIVEIPKQRNSREENAKIKAGQVPVDWDENKSSHKDTDARWVKKNGVSFFGYKDHIKTDADTSLITDYRVTQIMTTRQGLTRSGECEKMRKLSTAGWRVSSCNPNTKKDKQGDSFLSKRIRHSVRFAH